MVVDRGVPRSELHVSALAFPVVVEDAIVVQEVVVAVPSSALSRDQEDERMTRRRRNPALLLAAVLVMEVSTAVDPAYLKHFVPSLRSSPQLSPLAPEDWTSRLAHQPPIPSAGEPTLPR